MVAGGHRPCVALYKVQSKRPSQKRDPDAGGDSEGSPIFQFILVNIFLKVVPQAQFIRENKGPKLKGGPKQALRGYAVSPITVSPRPKTELEKFWRGSYDIYNVFNILDVNIFSKKRPLNFPAAEIGTTKKFRTSPRAHNRGNGVPFQ